MAIQEDYKDNLDQAYAGQIDTVYAYKIMSKTSEALVDNTLGFAQNYTVPGKAMVPGSDNYASGASIIDTDDDDAPAYHLGVGVLLHTGNSDDSGETRYGNGTEIGILEDGIIWMYCETPINFGEPLAIIGRAVTASAENNAKVGNVARRSATVTGTVLYNDAVHLRSLGVLTEAGLVRVRVTPNVPVPVVP